MLFSSQTSKGVTTRASSVQEILRALWLLCNLADFIRIHKMVWFATSRPSLRVRLCEGLSGDDYDSRGNGGWLVRGNTGHASLFPSLRDRWGKKSCLISWHDVALIVDLFSFGLLMIWDTLSSGIRKDVDYHEESKRNRECLRPLHTRCNTMKVARQRKRRLRRWSRPQMEQKWRDNLCCDELQGERLQSWTPIARGSSDRTSWTDCSNRRRRKCL